MCQEEHPIIREKRIMGLNDAWLAQVVEEPLEPALPICDAHHHLWGHRDHRVAPRYLLEDFLADVDPAGHNIVSTVFVDSRAMYRATGPAALKPVGEVEFAAGIGAMADSGLYGRRRVAAAIIGHADMRLGSKVGATLDAMMASPRFRGIRHATSFDEDKRLPAHVDAPVAGLMMDQTFRDGIAELDKRGLIYESLIWHPQLDELTDLARAFPNLAILVNHCGGPVGVGRHAGKKDENFAAWRKSMAELARCENVTVKLGGVHMMIVGHGWHERATPPTSDEMVAAAGPYITESIELFGTERGMFESNYPAERNSAGFGPLWNFFKKMTRGASAEEKARLYHDNAVGIYRIG
jgi:L-fuconolactonase